MFLKNIIRRLIRLPRLDYVRILRITLVCGQRIFMTHYSYLGTIFVKACQDTFDRCPLTWIGNIMGSVIDLLVNQNGFSINIDIVTVMNSYISHVAVVPDQRALLRGLLESSLGRQALQVANPATLRQAVLEGLAGYRTSTGGYRLSNAFCYLVGSSPQTI